MTIDIPYKKTVLPITLPDSIDFQCLEPSFFPLETSLEQMIEDSLESPVSSVPFREFLRGSGDLLVIVNDGTRPTPTRLILEEIADDLEKYGAQFIIATGVHRAPTDQEFRYIFGNTYERFRERILVHDARKTEDLEYYGESKQGTPIYLNKHCGLSGKILVIGSVEPHYFAGYTGGRKGFFPGIAGFETIEANHKLALDPSAKTLKLKGNPVHEDMMDCLKCLEGKEVFGIMTVLDKFHQIYAVSSGDLIESFYGAIDKADEIFVTPVEKKADIVISCAKYPMDVDLYQSQKAIDNGKLALKEGGILYVVSSCNDGLGEKAFSRLLSSSDSPQGVLEHIEKEYRLGYHKAAKMAEVFTWADVRLYSDLDDQTVRDLFMTPLEDLQRDILKSIEDSGENVSVIFIPDGCVTVPYSN